MQRLTTPSPAAPPPTSKSFRAKPTLALASGALIAALAATPAAAQSAAGRAAEHRRNSEAAGEVAQRYFSAYIARDWNTLEPMLDEGASFEDPTATNVFGSQRHVGKAAVMKIFREGYAQITEMNFRTSRVVSSAPYTVFSGELSWTLRLNSGRSVGSVMPLITTIRVDQGRVTSHVDLADYQPFLDALARDAAAPRR